MLFRDLGLAMVGGSALHITGSNGIGKSSLMRILAGLLRPYSGSVQRTGTVALLDENPALDPQLPLGKALQFWGRADRCDDAGEIASVLDMDSLLDVPFRYLSTGQRKRAAFARLVNQGAPIWLLDEPLNGLDAEARKRITALIKLHCSDGGICVIASHQAMDLPDCETLPLEEYAL